MWVLPAAELDHLDCVICHCRILYELLYVAAKHQTGTIETSQEFGDGNDIDLWNGGDLLDFAVQNFSHGRLYGHDVLGTRLIAGIRIRQWEIVLKDLSRCIYVRWRYEHVVQRMLRYLQQRMTEF